MFAFGFCVMVYYWRLSCCALSGWFAVSCLCFVFWMGFNCCITCRVSRSGVGIVGVLDLGSFGCYYELVVGVTADLWWCWCCLFAVFCWCL